MIERLMAFYKLCHVNDQCTMHELWQGITTVYHIGLSDALLSGDVESAKETIDTFACGPGLHGIEFLPGLMKWSDGLVNRKSFEDKNIPIPPDCFGFTGNEETGGIPHRFPLHVEFAELVRNRFGKVPERVLEIGAGLGWLGMILNQWGTKSYTILDIPSTSVLSAYFMSKVVGEDQVWLFGENAELDNRFARFIPSTYARNIRSRTYDVVCILNCFPEIRHSSQDRYLKLISECLSPEGMLISVNHECTILNQRSMTDAMKLQNGFVEISNKPSELIDGYVEQIFKIKSKA